MISLRSLYVSFSTYVSLFIYFCIFFGMILLIWHDIDLTWLPPAQTLNVCEGLKKVVNKSPFPLTNVIKKRFQLKKNWKIDKDGIKKKKSEKETDNKNAYFEWTKQNVWSNVMSIGSSSSVDYNGTSLFQANWDVGLSKVWLSN